jgi:hypothetical protein
LLDEAWAACERAEPVFRQQGHMLEVGHILLNRALVHIGRGHLPESTSLLEAEFSDFRAGQVTVFAPGVSIYSTYYDGGYVWWTGTSMAAPFVSGEAALLLSGESCDRDCATSLIQGSVHPVVPNLEPRGRVAVCQAVRAAPSQ